MFRSQGAQLNLLLIVSEMSSLRLFVMVYFIPFTRNPCMEDYPSYLSPEDLFDVSLERV